MKTFKLICVLLITSLTLNIQAQTADDIVNTYVENIGGADAWNKVTSIKVTGLAKLGGVDYPFVAIMMSDGRTNITADIQGNPFVAEAFDGETAWEMNFQTQKPEAYTSEQSLNYKNEAKDQFIDPFIDYKSKGYTIELLGVDTWESTEVHKIKLIKKPVIVDGKEEENSYIYYFDVESSVPIAYETVVKSGQAKGATEQITMSDYQEVDGLFMPFTVIEKYNGQTSLEMFYKKVEFNTDIDETIFIMPEN